MVGYDDSVAKLEDFCVLLAKTLGDLQESTTALESEGDSFNQAADAAAEKIGALDDEVSEWRDRTGSAGDEAAEQLAELEQSASRGADDRLSDVDERLQATEAATSERIDAGQETVDTGFADLEQQGFAALSTTVQELESDAEQLGQEADEDFEQMTSALDDARERMVQAGADVGEELAEAQQAVEQQAEGVGEDFEQAFSPAIEEQLSSFQAECDALGGALGQLYEGWAQEASSAADEYMASVAAALSEAADAVTAAGEELARSVEQTGEDALGTRQQDLEQTAAVLEAGESAASALEPIVDGLEIALRVVEQIVALLNEMGNA